LKTVIFSDLDGTLLHPKTYSFQEAIPALELIREKGVPLVLCSSKTRAELELYRSRLQNRDPFITENGGAVFAPRGYFPSLAGRVREDYIVRDIGTPYPQIRKAFVSLREGLRIPVKGFGDMSADEVSAITGLAREEAVLAREREFAEPFVFEKGEDGRFLRAIEEQGLSWTRGRLYCIMGAHDKGRAVRLLKQWYEAEHGTIITIGLGDGMNDLPLLREVDHPVLIRKEDGSYEPGAAVPGLSRPEGIGPAGWNQAVLELLKSNVT
jgi:mannosyl-3-phosphoglycerate phosphatase